MEINAFYIDYLKMFLVLTQHQHLPAGRRQAGV